MFPIREDLIWASGSFTCATPPVVEARDGFGAVTRTADGDYRLTLDRAINLLIGAGAVEGIVLATAHNAAAAIVTVIPLSTTVIQFLLWSDAGAALQAGRIQFVVLRNVPLT